MNEEWKTIELEGHLYEVSNFGRVRSISRFIYRKDGIKSWYEGKELNISETNRGYKVINITNTRKHTCTRYKLHRLVAVCFVDGKTRDKKYVNHIDGDKSNNNANNLEWVTDAENKRHAAKNELYCQGSRHPEAKFTEEEIQEIRNQYNNGISQAELRKKYHVSNATMFNIVHNISWKSVKEVSE